MADYDAVPEDLAPHQALVLRLIKEIAHAQVEQDVWDEITPEIFVVSTSVSALGFPQGVVTLLPVPDDVWRIAGHPRRALPIITGVVERTEDLGALMPLPVQAIALASESWELDIPEDATQEERKAANEFTQQPGHGIADHHWAVESKNVFALDADGWQFATSRFRGGGYGRQIAVPPSDAGAVTGDLPEGLAKLLAAMRREARHGA